MRRLVKLMAAAAIAAAAAELLRRQLEVAGDPEGGTGSNARPAAGRASGDGRTREQLYREAQEIGVEGRSKMNKRQLQEAVEAAKTGGRT